MAFEELGIPRDEQSLLARRALLDHIAETGLERLESDEAATESILELGIKHSPPGLMGRAEAHITRFAEENELTYFEAARIVAYTALSERDRLTEFARENGVDRWGAILLLAKGALYKEKGEQ